MGQINDRHSGKAYPVVTHSALSQSVAGTGTFEGRVYEFVGIDKIPYRLKYGDQAKYFDLTLVESGSIIRDTENGVVHVPFKKKNYQQMNIGVGSFISSAFSSTAYLEISTSFANTFSQIPNDTIITFMAEEFYPNITGSASGSFVGPVTASYELRTSNGVTQSYSGIDEGSGVDILIENNSSYATHGTYNLSLLGIELEQSVFFTSSLINFRNTTTNSSSYSSHDSPHSTPSSGSVIGTGYSINVNNSNSNDGIYKQFAIKGKIAGDADSGSLYTFLGNREIIIYSSSVSVSSGSFQYSVTSDAASTGSGVFKTLYYATGTTGPSGSYSGSLSLNTAPLSSPIHGDAELKTTASYGYYNLPGTTQVFTVSSSLVDNAGGTLVAGAMKVPRFVRRVTL